MLHSLPRFSSRKPTLSQRQPICLPHLSVGLRRLYDRRLATWLSLYAPMRKTASAMGNNGGGYRLCALRRDETLGRFVRRASRFFLRNVESSANGTVTCCLRTTIPWHARLHQSGIFVLPAHLSRLHGHCRRKSLRHRSRPLPWCCRKSGYSHAYP